MKKTTPRELDITTQAIASGLADKALKHYNQVMPWGARKRNVKDYVYILRMNSQKGCHVWMLQLQPAKEPVMYFSFNEKIGALTSSEFENIQVTMLNEAQVRCITKARSKMLKSHLQNMSS